MPDLVIAHDEMFPDSVTVARKGTDETCEYKLVMTCTVEPMRYNEYGYAPQPNDFSYDLSCGHTVTDSDMPDYCKYCGAKVV